LFIVGAFDELIMIPTIQT